MDDFYAILGIDPDASAEEVRAAYRALAQRFHPDHNPNDMAAQRRMQEINAAYAVLNSPERRAAYDEQRRLAAAAGGTATATRWAGRSGRPYSGHGPNWGLQYGATEPPSYVVRAEPTGFNLVSLRPGDCPQREIRIVSDAPFPVYARVEADPWLCVSPTRLMLVRGGQHTITVSIAQSASETLHGWRDGNVALFSADPRVYCPAVRITGIFLAPVEQPAPSPPAPEEKVPPSADESIAGERRGWLIAWLRRVLRL
jgi:hypothetical protein